MVSGLLDFIIINRKHDGKSLAQSLIRVLEDFGLVKSQVSITVDNASNNGTMMDKLIEQDILTPVNITLDALRIF
jgi:hypothetical protein